MPALNPRTIVAASLAVLLTASIAIPAAAGQPPAAQWPDPTAEAGVFPFPGGVYRTPPGVSFASDRLLVKFRDGASAVEKTGARQSINASLDRDVKLVPGLQVLGLRGSRQSDVIAAVAALTGRADVEYAMPDFAYELAVEPDDPSYPGQWAPAVMGAPSAWARSTGSNAVTVAVLDTGIDLDHPDLAANLVPGWNFVADTDNPDDDHGHGTHVAGIIGAAGNNGVGVTGVNWSVSLMPLKVCDAYGSCYLSAEIAALDFAVAHGARIANASFGALNNEYPPERDAIKAAGDAGLLYVAAAGNDETDTDTTPFYPADYPLANIISVGASAPDDQLAYFSNYGATSVDLVAPGLDIVSTFPDGYTTMSGTSMAAPQVAGAAALVKALHPTWTVQQIRRQLIRSATPVSALAAKAVSCGRLNLDAATDPATVLKAALCVARRGSGLGTVSSSDGAIACGATCAAFFAANSQVTLTATPDAGSAFGGWSGPCSGTGTCTLNLSAAASVGAVFIDPDPQGGWLNRLLPPPAGRNPLAPGSSTGRWTSFYNVALSANGKVRAKTVFNAPNGWCYYASSDTGGIFLERKTSSGWKADGVLTAPALGPEPGDRWMNCAGFGTMTELSGDGSTLLVGNDVFFDRCVAFVYRRIAGIWQLDGTLFPPGVTAQGSTEPGKCGVFTLEGAISHTGDRVAVYAPQAYEGNYRARVNVFARGTSGWALERTIFPPVAVGCAGWPNDTGDRRLAMSGDGASILIGDPYCSAGAGRVNHYTRSVTTWTKRPVIASPDPTGRWFGKSVAISADGLTAALGLTYGVTHNGDLTSSWVFELSSGTWTPRTRLDPAVADQDGSFSCAVLVRAGQRIVCTAVDAHGFNSEQGSLYVFNRPAVGWAAGSKRTRLFAPFGYSFERLGTSGLPWQPDVAAREDGTLIDATITPMGLVQGTTRDRIGYEFRR
ncbi:MAG TPA: S8 family serine peptidase [Candidatus Limnocylindrales bacterium]|nr:S8 family serine peptidase [Candidatus Limnocylindrales bacterium]